MSAWFNNAPPLLLEESVKIAYDFLERTGEVDDTGETCQFLVNKIGFMIAQGQRNRLLLANRAIAAYQHYRQARTLELSLVSCIGTPPPIVGLQVLATSEVLHEGK